MIEPLSGLMQSRASVFRMTILISVFSVVICCSNAHAQTTPAVPMQTLSISGTSATPSTPVTGSGTLTSGGNRTNSDTESAYLLGISTNLGTTYHKGESGQKVPDGYNSDGSLEVTTDDQSYGLSGTEAFTLTYSATPSGVWSKGSIYTWGRTASGISSGTRPGYTGATGTFDPGPIADLLVHYNQNAIKSGTTAGTDQINISATDKATGTQEHGKFDVTFYPPYCNWQRTNEPPTYSYTQFSGSRQLSANNLGFPVQVGSVPFSWHLAGQTASGFLSVNTVVGVNSELWWLVALATAAGGGLSMLPPPAANTINFSCNAAQVQYDYNVQLQVNANHVPLGTPPFATMSFAMQNEMATNPNIKTLLDGGYGQVSITPRFYTFIETGQWSADNYGSFGYSGKVDVPWPRIMANIPQGYWDFVPNFTSQSDN
jgi:hypothetical protein